MEVVSGTEQSQGADVRRAQLRRRGLVAGAAALVAGLVARDVVNSERVGATDGAALVVGTTNTTAGQTILAGTSTTVAAFRVTNSNYAGTTDTEADAIQGYTGGTGNSGALGRNDDLNGVGLYGIATNGTGIAGQSNGGSAISGSSVSGAGGYFTTTSGNGIYVSSGTNDAVIGTAGTGPNPATPAAGVRGISTSTNGGYGVIGVCAPGGTAALYGTSTGQYTPAFYAVNYFGGGANTGTAGYFIGSVICNGALLVNGQQVVGGTKSAAVPHPDGSHRLLYCVESPESWFEDFGTGTLSGGKADVQLDPDFAAVVDTKDLHVFLTSHDASQHLAVSGRSGSGFSVAVGVTGDAVSRGVKATDVSGTFTYRVVAKRKDVAAPRLAKFEFPKGPAVTPPPTPPTPPALTPRHADGRIIKK